MIKHNSKKASMLKSGSKQKTKMDSFVIKLPSLKQLNAEDKRVTDNDNVDF